MQEPAGPLRAYVSGDAGLGIVVSGRDTYVLKSDGSRPEAGSPGLLANLVGLSDDVDVYDTPDEPPFSRVGADVARRRRSSQCVDYIVAVFDPELPRRLRARAAKAAELLFQQTPDLIREMQRVFFSIAPPQNADLKGAANMSQDQPHVHELIARIGSNRKQIASLYERWEKESASLPTLAARAEAAALITQKALVAELLMGTYDESLVMSASPVIREAIVRWIAAGRDRIAKIEVERHGRVRRAKLYYLRNLRRNPGYFEEENVQETRPKEGAPTKRAPTKSPQSSRPGKA